MWHSALSTRGRSTQLRRPRRRVPVRIMMRHLPQPGDEMSAIVNDLVGSAVLRRPLIALVSIGMLLYGTLESRADNAPRPAPGEEYISAIVGGPVHPPEPAPARKPGEGAGPFKRLVIRGATMIDGTGAPAIGPVDIVIENSKIARIVSVGYPKVPIKESRRPEKGDYEIDAAGMYVLPGFINAHAHIADAGQGKVGDVPPAEYVYKLWLAHGI